MHEIKIVNYEREHGAGTFLWFRHLSEEDAAGVFSLLKRKLGLAEDAEGIPVLKEIQARSFALEGVDAEADDFDLKRILNQLKFEVPGTVYLNWYRFDDIDELRAVDLFHAFDDVWYPSSDDLEIFDPQLNWILSVTHHGAVSALRFEQ